MLWFFAPSHQPLRRSIVVDDTTLGPKERAGLWWWGLVKRGFLERYGLYPHPEAYSLHFEKGRGRKLEDDPFFLRWLFWKVLWYAMFASRVCIIYNQIIPSGDIYTNTFIGLPQGMHTMLWTTFLWVCTLIFFLTHRHFESTQPVPKSSSTAWGAPNRNKLSTAVSTGSHWFPCGVGVNSFYIGLPRCCVRDFPSRTEKAGWDPTIDKFPSAAWLFERRFIFVLLFDCFDVGMIHLRKMHWKCWSGWDGLI